MQDSVNGNLSARDTQTDQPTLPVAERPQEAEGDVRWPPVFEIKNLEKTFPHYQLTIDTLDIRSGIVALVGGSGTGKSTLLRILASLDSDYKGTVRFVHDANSSTRHANLSPQQRRREQFSYAFQTPNLLANLTIKSNVQLSRDLARVSDGDGVEVLARFFPELVENGNQVLLQKLARKYPSELSVGQRQRVAGSRALLKAENGALVLFADEPTANLDRRSADKCFEQLCAWQDKSSDRLLLLATHDLTLARQADHIILLGDNGSTPEKVEVCVIADGPTDECWPIVQERLVGSDGKVSKSSVGPTREPKRKRSVLPVLRLLCDYCLKDMLRGRDLVGTGFRCLVVSMLFFVLTVCSVLLEGVPRVADRVLQTDRLLRLVDVESTGQFPITAKKMNQLVQLADVDGTVKTAPRGTDDRHLVAGVSPKRELPLRLYRADGQVHQKWIDDVRIVYPEHAELLKGEGLFAFWGISPLRRDSGVVVSPKLLEKLGFDVKSFTKLVDDKSFKACLYVEENGWKLRIPVERVEKLPDDDVDLLVPSLLVAKIQKLGHEIVDERYRRAAFGPFADKMEAEDALEKSRTALREAVAEFEAAQTIQFAIDRSLDAAGKYAVWISTNAPKGFSKQEIGIVADAASQKTLDEYTVEFAQRILPGEPVSEELKATATMATLFVSDYRDVPAIIDYIEQNRETLKLKVLNAKNRESVKTAQLAVSLGHSGVWLIAVLFGLACLFGIFNSFAAMLRRKVGEIAVLRAFGAGPLFVLSRFVIETLLVCVLAGVVAILITSVFIVPYLNQAVAQFFGTTTSVDSPAFSFGQTSLIVVLSIIAATVILMAGIITPYLRKEPAELLSMAE